MILSRQELIAELSAPPFNVKAFCPTGVDERYFCPALGWLREFSEYLVWSQENYKVEKYDCDNFAMAAAVKANIALNRNKKIKDADSAFFFAVIMLASGASLNGVQGDFIFGGLHATNLVRCSDNEWYFFEPQSGESKNAKDVLSDNSVVAAVNFVLM